jgi:diguanylate cyclase (GGDEF)-like protein/PAS domain S-box-containing protein
VSTRKGESPAETSDELVDQLRGTLGKMELALSAIDESIVWTDEAGRIQWCNDTFERLVGRPRIVIVGTALPELLPLEHEGHPVARAVHPVNLPQIEGRPLTGTYEWRGADRRTIFEISTSRFRTGANAPSVVLTIHDVTERMALEEELRHQAFHDSLTGLANGALFMDRLAHSIARGERRRRPVAVLFLDLDDFKTVNDRLGHGVGDELLVAVGERLIGCLRPVDTVARMGRDEFAVLLDEPPDAAVPLRVAERIVETLAAPFELAGQELFVHASIGVAVATSHGQTAEEVLHQADFAMHGAKTRGKNRVEVVDAATHAAAHDRLALKLDLDRALQRGEFFLLYQPVMDLRTSTIIGVEALLRWNHPERGIVSPTEFIPLAEETGLIVPLGRWVLEQACRQARGWDGEAGARPLTMAVNVSGRQVVGGSVVADVARALEAADLEPSRLTLEITESVLMQDAEASMTTLVELKKLGVRLAIDDFGTGYSSLTYLRRFPIDVLKIDRSFVETITHGPEQSAVVRSMLKLGETLHLETIAEGIEHPEQLASLRSLKVPLGQGFYFARPLDPEGMRAFLREQASANDEQSPSA